MKHHDKRSVNEDVDLSAYKDLFLDQALTYLTILRHSLVQLKDDPEDEQSLKEARRATHTLKGMASTMRYGALAEMAERLESPLLMQPPLSPELIGTLMTGCDEFESRLERLK